MPTEFEDEWNRALGLQRKRLTRKKYAKLLKKLDYDSFKDSLDEEDRRYSNRNIARHVKNLGPIFKTLDSFVGAITSIIQAGAGVGGNLAGFVWGCVHAVIVVASRFVEVMDTVTEMIQDLTSNMTRLQRYMKLFPDDQILNACLRVLIEDYVGFCISALKFFARWPLYNLIRLFWSSIDGKFKKAKEDIRKHVNNFDAERQIAVDETVVPVQRDLAAALPRVKITPREPDNLYLVSYGRNTHFCGHDDVLSTLHKQLSVPPLPRNLTPIQRSTLLHGMGGVGKTQVAIEYAYRYRNSYEYIFWVRAETETEISDGMASIAKGLGLCEASEANSRAVTEKARNWLENTDKRWLLVFDNAENWRSLVAHWPATAKGSILVTSQRAKLAQMMRAEVLLKPLPLSDGANLLMLHLHQDKSSSEGKAQAQALSEQLGGLPLAIAHVAGYIWESGASSAELIDLLRKRSNSVAIFDREASTSTYQYEKTLGVVWDIALQELDGSALKLIQILSMLNPDGVPEFIFDNAPEDSVLSSLSSSPLTRQNMILSLRSRQLVEKEVISEASCLLMHRSLQRSVLHRLDADFDKFQHIFNLSFTLIRKVFPRQSSIQFPQNDNWERCERHSAQVMSLRNVYEGSTQFPLPSISFAEMLSDVSNYFWERNLFSDGLRASDTAEKICEKLSGQFPNQRANIHTIAAALRTGYGISERAGTLHRLQKVLALRQEYINQLDPSDVTVDDIINYAHAWSNVGGGLLEYEDYESSLLYLDISIIIRMKLGPEHKDHCFMSIKDKAVTLAALGRFKEAVALIPNDATLPQSGPYFAALQLFHCAWANIYFVAGDVDVAHAKLLQVLANRINLFGPSARNTLDTYYLLAAVKEKQGDLEGAIESLQKALERPSEWCEEARIRAKYQLGKLLRLHNPSSPSEVLEAEAKREREELWKKHVPYMSSGVEGLDEDFIYDHIVPCEAGRPTLGGFKLPAVRAPKLNQICHSLAGRIPALDDGILSPAELLPFLKIQSKAIPIEEKFPIS